jgi:hypothetical protein
MPFMLFMVNFGLPMTDIGLFEARPAEGRSNPGQKLIRWNRLGQKIIHPQTGAGDIPLIMTVSQQHNNGRGGHITDALANFKAGQLRQIAVQNNQVRGAIIKSAHPGQPIVRHDDVITFVSENTPHMIDQIVVVIDD